MKQSGANPFLRWNLREEAETGAGVGVSVFVGARRVPGVPTPGAASHHQWTFIEGHGKVQILMKPTGQAIFQLFAYVQVVVLEWSNG